ncbi:hypothetical protein [Actinomycetospora soli]|uniref:hypothetical protein n=1 Tax=Actinomycetospora soli TaxID=2893887 RepID=UPI001E62BD46|nr:hypothetical protein [Actinomycetospora soli]MCD2191326.1 hypothetical protein [Actinomycetospora soli]
MTGWRRTVREKPYPDGVGPRPGERAYVAPELKWAVSVGYLLRASWTAIAAAALIHTAAAGPIPDPLASPWLRAATVLAALDLVVYLGILAAQRLRPALGTGWLETPLVTIILAVAALAPGSINATSAGGTIFMTVWLVGLTGYTLVAHLWILRWYRRHRPPPLTGPVGSLTSP